jgi:type II secretory pathway pseudopilin PulG
MNKQLVNLAGVLTIIVILVAGVALIALPMYSQSQATDAQTRTVANTNMVYEQQIIQLSAAESRLSEIDSELSQLRGQIAAAPQLDDVHEIVAAAARDVDAQIESVTVGDPQAWALRDGSTDAAALPAETPDESGDAAAGVDDAEAGTPDSPAAPSADEAATDAAPAGEPEAAQQQVLVTITIDLTKPFARGGSDGGEAASDDDVEADPSSLGDRALRATRFVDLLGNGPRLLAPVDLSYEDGTLTVAVLAFFHPEGS